MFNNSGLSMDQAPPIKVVLRFFLTGSFFGIVAGLAMLFFGSSLEEFSSTQAIILTHLLTLGVMASFMFGALFQMLPVLCGVHIKMPTLISLRVNYALIFGIIFLISALYTNYDTLYILASLSLGFAIFTTAFIMINKLRVINHNNSSRGMMLSLISLVVVAVLGILMVSIRSGIDLELDYLWIKGMHYNFGLYGWIALLIISVSFQVIEMFYITPPYPKLYAKYLPVVLFGLIVANLTTSFFISKIQYVLQILTVVTIAIHAIFTLIRLKQKKRALTDATVLFWTVGQIALLLFTIALIANFFITIPTITLAILFSFFSLSIIYAMSYKIVPFLVWFHLNAQGYFDAPMMHEVTPPNFAKINLQIFVASFIATLLAPFIIYLWQIASILLTISFFMLFLNIYRAIQKYKYVIKNGKKFNFNIE